VTAISEHTSRFSDNGLITRGQPKQPLGRIMPGGAIHKVTAVWIQWDLPPFMRLSYGVACGTRVPACFTNPYDRIAKLPVGPKAGRCATESP
jgi:hypothetical protein